MRSLVYICVARALATGNHMGYFEADVVKKCNNTNYELCVVVSNKSSIF